MVTEIIKLRGEKGHLILRHPIVCHARTFQTSLPSLLPHCRQNDDTGDDDDVVMQDVPGTNAEEEEDESGTGHLKAGV